MPWTCDRCESVLPGTPSECDVCGHNVVRLVRHADLVESPEPVELPQTTSDGGLVLARRESDERTPPVDAAPAVEEVEGAVTAAEQPGVIGRLKARLFG